MLARQGTSDGQDHKRIQRAGQEQDMSGHLPVRASRWRGSPIHGQRLAWITAQGPRTVFSSAVIAKVSGTNYKKANEFLDWLIKIIGHVHCNWQEAMAYVIVTFAPASDAHAHGDSYSSCRTTVRDKLYHA